MLEKTLAFVLHRRPWKNFHEIVWLFTKTRGLLPTLVYGISHFGSRRSSHLDLLNFSEIELERRKGNTWTIRHAHALRTFPKIKRDFLTSIFALACASVLPKILPVEMRLDTVFVFLQKFLFYLEENQLETSAKSKKLYRSFEKRLLETLGYVSRTTHIRPEHIRNHLERSEETLKLFIGSNAE